MIIVDSREKKWNHIKDYFDMREISYQVSKLDTGDYMNTDNPSVIIDRKQNLDEVAQNLCSKDSSRFWREIRRAKESKIHLIILVEHGGQIHSVKDVPKWNSKYSRIKGTSVADKMFRAYMAYGCEWRFCDKRKTGKVILELLNGVK